MSRRQARHQGDGNGARGPVRGVAAALAIACLGSVGGLVLASYATDGTRSATGTGTYQDSAWSDAASGVQDFIVDAGASRDAPRDYRCQGCGPGLAAQTAARFGAGDYDSAGDYYGAGYADDARYPVEEGEGGYAASPLPAYRPMPFDGPATTPLAVPEPLPASATRRSPPPAVKPVSIRSVPGSHTLPPLSVDRLPTVPGERSLAPATSEEHSAGGKAQQQQR